MTSISREELRATIKEIIVSIKPLDGGLEALPDDAPLFEDDQGEPSPVELDSLDGLDLAMAIGERFGLQGEWFDRLFNGEFDLQSLRTVNNIVEFIISVQPQAGGTAGNN